jgi:hypothetical protein
MGLVAVASVVDTDLADTDLVDTDLADTDLVDTDLVDTDLVDTDPDDIALVGTGLVGIDVVDTAPVDTPMLVVLVLRTLGCTPPPLVVAGTAIPVASTRGSQIVVCRPYHRDQTRGSMRPTKVDSLGSDNSRRIGLVVVDTPVLELN